MPKKHSKRTVKQTVVVAPENKAAFDSLLLSMANSKPVPKDEVRIVRAKKPGRLIEK